MLCAVSCAKPRTVANNISSVQTFQVLENAPGDEIHRCFEKNRVNGYSMTYGAPS